MLEYNGQPARGTEPAGARLSRLSEASLRINESVDVDLDTALQAMMDGVRFLTGAPLRHHRHPGRFGPGGRPTWP